MHFRCNGPILLGAIAISVALATMKPDIVKKPYGPKVCERLCNRIAGCSSFIYRTSDLSCHPKSVMQQNQDKGMYRIKATKDKERMRAENAVNCSDGDRLFRSRRHVIQCKPALQNFPNPSSREDKKEGRMTRILMMPYTKMGNSLPGRQLYLANNSIVTYPFFEFKHPVALAYIPSQRKLILTARQPNLIVLVPVDEDKKTVLKTKYIIKGIAIDDDKELVFMRISLTYNTGCVGAMTTHGTNQTIILRLKMPCRVLYSGGIVADHKHSLIYFMCTDDKKLLQITYQGVIQGHLTSDVALSHGLFMKEDILYMIAKEHVFIKVSLSNHSFTKLGRIRFLLPRVILNAGNILYMIPSFFKGDLLVVNMSDLNTVTKLNAGFGVKIKYIVMCLIP